MILKIYLTNLGKYNEGELIGEWVKLPISPEELEKVLERIGIDDEYEEYFVTDYETDIDNFSRISGEYPDIEELNELAEEIDNLSSYDKKVFEAIMEIESFSSISDISEAIDNIDDYNLYEDIEDDYDLGYYFAEECGCLNLPENLKYYFDYSSYGRDIDLESSGGFTSHGYLMYN